MAGGGIGEAALIGAAFGGGKALISGEDPLKAALLGGVTGGAMSGIGSVFSQGANNLSAVASGPNIDAAGNAFEPLAPNTVPDFVPPAPVAPVAPVANEGIASIGQVTGNGQMGVNLSNAPTVQGGYVEGQSIPAGVDVHEGIPSQGIVDNMKPDAPFMALKRAINPEAGGYMDKGLDFAIKNPYLTAGGAGAAYGALTPKKFEEPKKKEEKSPLAGFSQEDFTAYQAPRPDPYPQARYTDYFNYAKEGGVMQSYAQGGITDLAAGGEMAGQGYPQGLIQGNQYANPTQAPMGQEVVSSGYEPAINTYTGSRVGPGMAEGGIASFAYGGATNTNNQNRDSMIMGRNGRMGNKAPNMDINPSVGNYSVAPIQNHYQAQYQQQAPAPTLTYNGPQGGYAPNYSLGDSMGLLAATNPGITRGMAGGGMAGYNLGGYASGGNPRLLKGPGDGMSDNIPATIGGRQPARLADGEFVVPADVVSHLGNGSTDAGAKHLYAMMDKVRTARTGRKAQGKQINPAKYMPR